MSESAWLRWGLLEGRRLQLGGLVHENKDFCGRENKIVASVHEMCRLGEHDGQFEVYALEKGHSDDRTQQMREFGDLARGTKQAGRRICQPRCLLTKHPVQQS